MKRKTIRKHADFICPSDTLIARTDLFLIKVKHITVHEGRYGLVVPKKDFRFATQRNRAKRLMRDWIAYNEELMLPDYDYIFLINNDVLESDRETGRTEVERSLKKISKILTQNEN